MSVSVLERELQTFEACSPFLLDEIKGHIGEVATYALVKGTDVIGTYATENDAINIGYQELGNVPFLVKSFYEYVVPRDLPMQHAA